MFDFFKKGNASQNGRLRLYLLLGCGVLGILLILLGSSGKKAEKTADETPYSTSTDELVIYQDYLESRIKKLCESVSGVRNVTVVVTLSGSFESVYATEWPDGNEEYVILGSGSSASPIYLSRSAPEIAGIGIVCLGGSNDNVRRELIALLSATFHISSNRIYITEAG
ncbi:MAG: hypothetical protein E7584_02345 [Ruminococcaceae bacterium]|nr:hypothetical protein [Oscillospiraceae bacterium]